MRKHNIKTSLMGVMLAACSVNAHASLFWTQTGPGGFQTFGPSYVMQANDDGTGAVAIVSGDTRIKGPNGLESFGSELFWPDQQITGGKVNADGSGYARVPNLSGYDVDVTADKLYVTSGSNGKIYTMNPDGSNYTELLSGLAFSFAVDATDEYLYWSEFTSQKIRRSNLDGTGIVDLVSGVTAFEMEVTANNIYYADTYNGDIWRSGLDGSNPVRLIDGVFLLNGIDVTDQYIYWSTLNTATGGAVYRSNLDGSGEVNLYTAPTGINIRGVVALSAPTNVPIPASLPLFLSSLGLLAGLLKRRH